MPDLYVQALEKFVTKLIDKKKSDEKVVLLNVDDLTTVVKQAVVDTSAFNFGSCYVTENPTDYVFQLTGGTIGSEKWSTQSIRHPKSDVGWYVLYVYSGRVRTTNIENYSQGYVIGIYYVPANAQGHRIGFDENSAQLQYVYGYAAVGVVGTLLVISQMAGKLIRSIDGAKIEGDLVVDGTVTIQNLEDSVRLTADALQILEDENLLALFNKTGIYFFDTAGNVLSKFDRTGVYFYNSSGNVLSSYRSDGANIAGWRITANTLESENKEIILDSLNKTIDINANGGLYLYDNSGNLLVKLIDTGLYIYNDNGEEISSYRVDGAHVAGWQITVNEIASANQEIVLDSMNKQIKIRAGGSLYLYDASEHLLVKLTDTGLYLYNTSGELLSSYTTTGANIAGWNITSTTLESANQEIVLDSNSKQIKIQSGGGLYIYNTSGQLLAKFVDSGAYFYDTSGNVLSSYRSDGADIAGWKITSNTLESSSQEIVIDSANKQIKIQSGGGLYLYDTLSNLIAKLVDTGLYLYDASGNELSAYTSTGAHIAGWQISTNLLKSANEGIQLNANDNRIEIWNTGSLKLAFGYLGGIGSHDSTEFGIWVGAPDALYIEASGTDEVVQQVSGDWVVQNDADIKIKDGSGNEVLRIGTDSAERGLFIWNASGTLLAKYTSNGIYFYDSDGNELSSYTSSDAHIAGWKISSTTLGSENQEIIIDSANKQIKIQSGGGLYVYNTSGQLLAKFVDSGVYFYDASNNILSSYCSDGADIAGWQITTTTLESGGQEVILDSANKCIKLQSGGSLYLYDTGGHLLTKLTDTGLYLYNASGNELSAYTSTGAHVAGWKITPTTLESTNQEIVLDSNNKQIKVQSGGGLYLYDTSDNLLAKLVETGTYFYDASGNLLAKYTTDGVYLNGGSITVDGGWSTTQIADGAVTISKLASTPTLKLPEGVIAYWTMYPVDDISGIKPEGLTDVSLLHTFYKNVGGITHTLATHIDGGVITTGKIQGSTQTTVIDLDNDYIDVASGYVRIGKGVTTGGNDGIYIGDEYQSQFFEYDGSSLTLHNANLRLSATGGDIEFLDSGWRIEDGGTEGTYRYLNFRSDISGTSIVFTAQRWEQETDVWNQATLLYVYDEPWDGNYVYPLAQLGITIFRRDNDVTSVYSGFDVYLEPLDGEGFTGELMWKIWESSTSPTYRRMYMRINRPIILGKESDNVNPPTLDGLLLYDDTNKYFKYYGTDKNQWYKIVRMQESTTTPSGVYSGELWFNTNLERLYIYDSANTAWRRFGTIYIASSPPTDKYAGDFWYDTDNGVMYYYDAVNNIWRSLRNDWNDYSA